MFGQLQNILSQRVIDCLCMVLPLVLALAGMAIAVAQDAYIGKRRRIALFHVIALALLLIVQNVMGEMLPPSGEANLPRTVLSVLGYSIRPMLPVLLLALTDPGKSYLPEWGLVGTNALVYLSAFISPATFWYDSDGAWTPGPLRNTCLIVSAVLLVELAARTIRRYRGAMLRRDAAVPICCCALVACSLLLDYSIGTAVQLVSFLNIAVVVSSLFYYLWLHERFVRKHERNLQAEQRVRIMTTQIQPHFLFNALNTIRALYDTDPPLAGRTLENFSTYLRQNLESLDQAGLVPFARELDHVRLYAEIEVLRFPRVRVEYRVEDDDFRIPALTVQPLVENAIRHGVRNQDQGLVIVSAVREEAGHRVAVRDNGVGFDPHRQLPEGESHIGLENVRRRVELMCGGTMEVESEPGEGACITLFLPDAGSDAAGAGPFHDEARSL